MAWSIQKWLGKCGCNIQITVSSCKQIIDTGNVEIELVIGSSPITLTINFNSIITAAFIEDSRIEVDAFKASYLTLKTALTSGVYTEEMNESLMKMINYSISKITITDEQDCDVIEEKIINSLITELRNKVSNNTDSISDNSSIESGITKNSNIE